MKDNTFSLSVVVPVYNAEKYLSECIESILNQIYNDFELILIDDGSTDDSGKICDYFAQKDERIRVLHQANQGVMKSRAAGVSKSVGQYVTFVDSDDWIQKDIYQDLMSLINAYEVDIVLSGIYRYHSENNIFESRQTLREGLYCKQDIEKEVIPYMLWDDKIEEWKVDPSLCTKIFKREFIVNSMKKSGKLDAHYGDDTSIIFPMLMEVNSIYVSHKAYYFHRQREATIEVPYFKDKEFFGKLYAVYEYLKQTFENSKYADVMQRQLEMFYMNSIQLKKNTYLDIKQSQIAVFPFWQIPKESRVIIYGAGMYGESYIKQNIQNDFCEVVAWVDKNYEICFKKEMQVWNIDMIKNIEYDYILIAVARIGVAKEIIGELYKLGVTKEKIIWNASVIQEIGE